MVDTLGYIPGPQATRLIAIGTPNIDAAERRSAAAAGTPANETRPWSFDRRLVIYRRVTFLMQRRSVEGRIEAIDRTAGTAQVRISTPPFAGILRVEPLRHLVAIDVDGRPFTD